MSTREQQTQAHHLADFIIAHELLLWAGVILAIIGLIFILARNRYEWLNLDDAVIGMICGFGLTGAFLGRDPRHALVSTLITTDAGTVALTLEILALLLVVLLIRVRLGHE